MNNKSHDECEEIYYSALLHDVGKIGVPNEIINKPGKLTREEYEIIKQHPATGAKILKDISEYPYLSIAARWHHERYDGKGYPDGLKGEEIPEIARIVSVADAYDAMTSVRSYREPIPQDRVREEIVKGAGTQFDPDYARLMLHLIDIDTEYQMKERAKHSEYDDKNDILIGEYRSAVSSGILITAVMTTVCLSVSSDDERAGIVPSPSVILFDYLDGAVHIDEKVAEEMLYFEYGEIWFDGKTETRGARKMQSRIIGEDRPEIRRGEYRIEAVRIADHALIRIAGKKQTCEVTVALPDCTRFMYIGLSGEHCRIGGLDTFKADEECPADYIPRIAEKISYIADCPEGDVPNLQIDGFRTEHSEGIEIKDGLTIAFHARSLPTARLVWHCPFIDIFCAEDGTVNGKNYRDLAFLRFDGEFWECDPSCEAVLDVKKTDDFKDRETWKKHNIDGYDAAVTFEVSGGRITMMTENGGVSVKNTLVMSGIGRKVYAAVTGDQVALTNIRYTYK